MSDPIRLGTRASELARTQSATVGRALAAAAGRPWVEVPIRSVGDDTTKPLDQPGSPGLFVSTLRRALLAGEVDVIVHSFKDLPSAPEPGIHLAAVPERQDPRDALVSRDGLRLADLPTGAVVGTSSPRRAAALARMRPDLRLVPVRGNVDTRIARVRNGEVDATVLAVAGLSRVGRLDEVTEYLDDMIPAPAQGALAVECRADDDEMRAALAKLDDPAVRAATAAERYVLVGINAACTTPIAAHARYADGALRLRAELTVDGRHSTADVSVVCADDDVAAARTLGLRAATELVGRGSPVVLLIRSESNESDAASLAERGLAGVTDPYVQITPLRASSEAGRLTAALAECADDPVAAERTWVVATSPMTVSSWLVAAEGTGLSDTVRRAAAAGVRAAAVGERTSSTLRDLGFVDVLVPEQAYAEGLVAALADFPPGRALFPRGNLALRTLPDGLRGLGWAVEETVVYETAAVPERPPSADLVEAGAFAAVILRSPSAVRSLTEHATVPPGMAVICGGSTTARAAEEAGLRVDAIASSPSSDAVADAVAALLATR